ncbi:hypothetical protein [Gemmatimonas sp.]|uniref:hypothetical protein n=1 Tax=Gemmatimonas sp. TaxID=1962908 RepID=UPI00356558AF
MQVMAYMASRLEHDLLAPMHGAGTLQARLDAMLRTPTVFYDKGRKPCLPERLCASVDGAGHDQHTPAQLQSGPRFAVHTGAAPCRGQRGVQLFPCLAVACPLQQG